MADLFDIAIARKLSGGGGGGASGMIVNAVDHPDESRVYLDKTWNEIKSAILNGSTVYIYDVNGAEIHYGIVVDLYTNSSQYSVVLQLSQYDCDSADDYPKYYYG